MTITVGGTSITFNDATTQTTAPVNTNANVTSISAGSGISVSASTGAITITNSNPGGGGVTSLNGQTGAITNTGFNAIGSYCAASYLNGGNAVTSAGTTVAGSSLAQYSTSNTNVSPFSNFATGSGAPYGNVGQSGTWRAMASSRNSNSGKTGYLASPNLWVRVS